MLEETVANAEKISEKIVKNNKEATVSDELVREVAGRSVSTNDLALTRRVIPFVSNVPIIQEKHSGMRQRIYRPMSRTEFDQYELTDKNFYKLSMDDIVNIRKRIKKVKPDISSKELLRMLTLCDIFVQSGAKRGYTKYRKRYVAYSVNINPEELEKRLRFLENAGILSISTDRKVRYNEVFNDIGMVVTENKTNDIRKKTKKEIKQDESNFEDTKKKLGEIGAYINSLMDEIQEMQKQMDAVKDENEKLRGSYNKMKASYDSISVVLSSYKNLKASTDKIVEKRVREYRNLVGERVEKIFYNASSRMTSIFEEERNSNNMKAVEFKLNSLMADTAKSAQTAVKAWGFLKNNDKN